MNRRVVYRIVTLQGNGNYEVARASELFDVLKQRPQRRHARGVSPTLFGAPGS
jgi:hypothetical protein